MSSVSSATPHRRPTKRGRPRRADADAAILAATLELLSEVGFAGLSMDLLAQRAGVGKATIYRRWGSKESLILDTLRTMWAPLPVPDEGTLRGDLLTYMTSVTTSFGRSGRDADVLPHLIEASCYDEQLRASLDEYLRQRQATTRLILDRGMARGEIASDTDIDLVTDLLLGSFFYRRLLTGSPVDRAFIERLVDYALR